SIQPRLLSEECATSGRTANHQSARQSARISGAHARQLHIPAGNKCASAIESGAVEAAGFEEGLHRDAIPLTDTTTLGDAHKKARAMRGLFYSYHRSIRNGSILRHDDYAIPNVVGAVRSIGVFNSTFIQQPHIRADPRVLVYNRAAN